MIMKRATTKLVLTACALMAGAEAICQISTKEAPVSLSYPKIEWDDNMVSLPPLDMSLIAMEDSLDEINNVPPRFGYRHEVNLTLENSGKWTVLPTGDRLWRLKIHCPQATSINLLYDQWWLPDGAKYFVYDNACKNTLGAFTSKNNKGEREEGRGFSTGLVFSDTVVLEYYEPQGVSADGIISISHVVHGYIGLTPGSFPLGFSASGHCQVDVNCEEGIPWYREKDAVAMILVHGNRNCSGALINSTENANEPLFSDGKPLHKR